MEGSPVQLCLSHVEVWDTRPCTSWSKFLLATCPLLWSDSSNPSPCETDPRADDGRASLRFHSAVHGQDVSHGPSAGQHPPSRRETKTTRPAPSWRGSSQEVEVGGKRICWARSWSQAVPVSRLQRTSVCFSVNGMEASFGSCSLDGGRVQKGLPLGSKWPARVSPRTPFSSL